MTAYTCDADGKVLAVRVGGNQLAGVTYDSLQRLAQVTYPDGSALTQVGRDKAERVVSQKWSAGGPVDRVDDVSASADGGRIVTRATAPLRWVSTGSICRSLEDDSAALRPMTSAAYRN